MSSLIAGAILTISTLNFGMPNAQAQIGTEAKPIVFGQQYLDLIDSNVNAIDRV